MDHTDRLDHTRSTLPATLAVRLADAHSATGRSYRDVAHRIGIDYGYWRRITLGQRSPSKLVAMQIIDVLDLPDDVADDLLEAAVPTRPRFPG